MNPQNTPLRRFSRPGASGARPGGSGARAGGSGARRILPRQRDSSGGLIIGIVGGVGIFIAVVAVAMHMMPAVQHSSDKKDAGLPPPVQKVEPVVSQPAAPAPAPAKAPAVSSTDAASATRPAIRELSEADYTYLPPGSRLDPKKMLPADWRTAFDNESVKGRALADARALYTADEGRFSRFKPKDAADRDLTPAEIEAMLLQGMAEIQFVKNADPETKKRQVDGAQPKN